VYWYYSPHIQAVFSERPGLVKAESVDGTTKVDAAGTDAEDVLPTETFLCKDYADSHSRR